MKKVTVTHDAGASAHKFLVYSQNVTNGIHMHAALAGRCGLSPTGATKSDVSYMQG